MKRILIVSLLLLMGSTARADTDNDTRTRNATAIIGSSVTIQSGDATLGKVVDLVINENGCVEFLVVTCEDDYIAVPWMATTYTIEKRIFVITADISRERLKELRFTRDRWPDFSTGVYTQKLRTTWGEK
jgi:hypothetical protein